MMIIIIRLGPELQAERVELAEPRPLHRCAGGGPGLRELDPQIPQKRLQTQEDTPRKQGDIICIIVFVGLDSENSQWGSLGAPLLSGPLVVSFYVLV